ncbi:hypothetical protein LWI29_003469 [Acer saccharum]|uniref:Uncharacterized protein n=1 Tax=Acer saccharum TaxID=4024 RepID=A0AA39S9Y2_ACESA|nr:hypothetical protein LWI29_003469 [Acer saccharum]
MVVLWIQRRVYMNHSLILPSVSSTFLKFQVHSPNSDCLMNEYQNLYKKQLPKAPETALVWTLHGRHLKKLAPPWMNSMISIRTDKYKNHDLSILNFDRKEGTPMPGCLLPFLQQPSYV